jgi:hypothetical protein
MENDLVRYSRAGDAFHYRWAARRCLRMIDPKSHLRCIVIEGSKERDQAGEYVIDVTEYTKSSESEPEKITYFQLKHTTVRKDRPINLSDLKDTFKGFAERYSEQFCQKKETTKPSAVTFPIVTNRPIAESFKKNMLNIVRSSTVNTVFQHTLEKYTNLKGKYLKEFCSLLEFTDIEGDYNEQRYKLNVETSHLIAGIVDTPLIDSIITLVAEKALPNSNGEILREDILKRFGVTSIRDLFPAPPEFEELINPLLIKQHQSLLNSILYASTPIIIHAAGGVGKSIFACQMAEAIPKDSIGIVYDCFGGGRYRNPSEPRHRHRDALIQVVNELSSYGLCDPLIALPTSLEDQILRKFLKRLSMVADSLRESNENAILIIFIDAADNAEMAAEEIGDNCFVHDLLHCTLPNGCRIVALCRTERIQLLQPSSLIPILELESFSIEDTLTHIRRFFPQATSTEGLEFHRLTNNGNPRVQSNALNFGYKTISKILNSLGPFGTTVEKQIEAQLGLAISVVKESLPSNYQRSIDAICLGLAILPPHIPIRVLATAAEVDEAAIKSFIADLGRSILLLDTSVQFRDEPTETWFRNKFSAAIEQIAAYITRLKPLASDYSYIAETLPSLLLQSEAYDELINLALSDDFLPEDNPIDKRNVRVYRLQFAFKAALKNKRYSDATKLALRAGEEVAGNNRQLELLTRNIDLIAPLQNAQRVQELSFRHMLHGKWDGSDNIYSAALLSSVKDFKGEARAYLRAANNWLHLYFEERKKNKETHAPDLLENDDILELTFARYNLFGVSKTVDSFMGWHPPQVVYPIARKFIKRLIDAGSFDAVNKISLNDHRNQYLMIAIAHELLEVGHIPQSDSMGQCLILLTTSRTRIPEPGRYSHNDTISTALVSFTEACAARKLSTEKILRVLRYYIPIRAPQFISSDYLKDERDTYLRAVALRCVLMDKLDPNLDDFIPKDLAQKEKNTQIEQDVRKFKEIIGGLLPWYIVRAQILVNDLDDAFGAIKDADQRSKKAREQRWRNADRLPFEITQICIKILILLRNADPFQVESFYTDHIKAREEIWIHDRLKLVRAAFRLGHLSKIRTQLEQSTYEIIVSTSGERPETRSEWYIDLARAVLPVNRDDAAAYFDYAIEAVSKFGDEIVQRWEAVTALANRSAVSGHTTPKLAYRFFRCAEMIGDNVAREKYWDRDEAVRICAKLSPVSALAGLSRWNDRDVGRFYQQLSALANELVVSDIISPSVGWALSAFFDSYGLEDFALLCIEKEKSTIRRQYILDTAIRDLRLNEATCKTWQKLKQITQKLSIQSRELEYIINFYAENPEKTIDENTLPISHSDYQDKKKQVDWESIFSGLELATNTGIGKAIVRFRTAPTSFNDHETFWKEIFKHIDESESKKFLVSLVETENA